MRVPFVRAREKYYNRPSLRREVRTSGSLSFRELEALVNGSIEHFQRVGRYDDLSLRILDLTKCQKWMNAYVASIDRKVDALLKRVMEEEGLGS